MTETLRCVAMYETMLDQDRDLSYVVCGEPIRLREGGACTVCDFDADNPLHFECADGAGSECDIDYHHDFQPGYEHVSGDRGHPAKAPVEVEA